MLNKWKAARTPQATWFSGQDLLRDPWKLGTKPAPNELGLLKGKCMMLDNTYSKTKCALHCAGNCAHKSDHNIWIPAFIEFVIYSLFLPSPYALPYGSWFNHACGWMSMRDKENFLIRSYEEMKWVTIVLTHSTLSLTTVFTPSNFPPSLCVSLPPSQSKFSLLNGH